MKKAFLSVMLLCHVFSQIEFANAADCICPVIPMFPADGSNWYHYSLVKKQGDPTCVYQYPTGFVGLPQYSKSCDNPPHPANSCGSCSALGTSDVDEFEVYYQHSSGNPHPYNALDSEPRIRAFFKTSIPVGADPSKYDRINFSGPYPTTYTKPVYKLSRMVNSNRESFYVILWQLKDSATGGTAFAGVEIKDLPLGATVLIPPGSIDNAVQTESSMGTTSHKPVPGLLQVRFASATNPADEQIAIIRLYDSVKNRNANYPPHHP